MSSLKAVAGAEPVPVENDGKLLISTGRSRFETSWKNREIKWSSLIGKLKHSVQTHETHAEYMQMTKDRQDQIKDIGGFVGGHLKEGHRRNGTVMARQIVTLDADFLQKGQSLEDLVLDQMDRAFCVYSTHKNTQDRPRQRLIMPLSRSVTPEEYEAIARRIADKVGIDLFDDTTFQPTRLMYWPSHSADIEPHFYRYDAEWVDPDEVLAEYPDWTDTSFWPMSSRMGEIRKREADKAGDPLEKQGVIGAFCRTYDIHDAISKFLPEIYTPTEKPDRYTYAAGSTAAGLVVYEGGLFAYSNHSTDPAGGRLCNAFDLVRLHKYGQMDEDADPAKGVTKLPSYKAMLELAREDAGVKVTLAEERAKEAVGDFGADEDWREKLELKKDGSIVPNVRNALILLQCDEKLQGIRMNAMSGTMVARGEMPWARDFEDWLNVDTDQLYTWIANTHGVQFPQEIFQKVLITVSSKRRFHPVKDYLAGLPEWDGVERIDRLLIDCMGAEDNIFNREAMRKMMLAAIARIKEPGIKFDNMLVLNGAQGIGKSTFFRRLFKGYVSDSLTMLDMRDKTGSEKVRGYWALEVAEMAGMRKADIESVKGFISRQEDIYRPAFGRTVERHPRQCVLVGSTNSDNGFLRDVTGNRRFWPVKCYGGKVKPWELEEKEIDQMWSEAMAAYEVGESLLLSPEAEELARAAQKDAIEEDPRTAQVQEYLDLDIPVGWDRMDADARRMYLEEPEAYTGELKEREAVSNMEIWVECLGRRPAEMERKDADALSAIMIRMDGWKRSGKQMRISIYGKQRMWVRVQEF